MTQILSFIIWTYIIWFSNHLSTSIKNKSFTHLE
nr:MAG TPA: hypothetical protein [Caudoviricetes sp.]